MSAVMASTSQTFDCAIIGGGIAGASVAYFLADRGRVALLEQEDAPGYHATGRSAAVFADDYGNEDVRALTRAARKFMVAPPAGFAATPLLSPRGCLYIARPEQLAALENQQALSPQARAISPDLARARVPVLREDYLAGALFDPELMDIDVNALHQGFLAGAARRGMTTLTDARAAAFAHDGRAWSIDTPRGTVRARVVVNAAGAWADAVALQAGAAPLGLDILRRTAVLVDPPKGRTITDWPFVVDIDEAFYFKPDAGRLFVSPADETPSPACDIQPDELDKAIAIDRLQQAADLPVRRIFKAWAGLRVFAADRSPVIGYDARLPDFFWLAGLGGYGVQTAPAVGALAAALILREAPPETLAEAGVVPAGLSPARPLHPI